MLPKQGLRERVYVLSSYLRDDNGDMVEGTDRVLAGTSSESIGKKVLACFEEARNGLVTMVHDRNRDAIFPSAIQTVLDGPEEPNVSEEVSVSNILGMVDM